MLFLFMCVRLYIMFVILGIVVVTVGLTGIRFAKPLSKALLVGMGIDVKVYGTPDPSARIVAFNHPLTIDACILNAVVGPVSGLISFIPKYEWAAKLYSWAMECVPVFQKRGGGGGRGSDGTTTKRLLEKLKTSTTRYGVSVNRPRHRGVGGKTPGDKIHAFHTIAFRLKERVQPAIIVVDEAPYFIRANGDVSFWDYVRMPLQSQSRIRVYLLSAMSQRPDESSERFAERTRRRMNRCLQRAWKHPEHALPSCDRRSFYTSLCFSAMTVVCFFTSLHLYGLGWLGLTLSSSIYHYSSHPSVLSKYIDKGMVYTVIAQGAYYFTYLTSPFLRIVAVVSFVAVCILYCIVRSKTYHPYVHLSSILGHLAIVMGLH